MSIRALAVLMLALWAAPSAVEAGLFGSSNKKKLPKPIKMVKFRPHDTERLAKVHRLGL